MIFIAIKVRPPVSHWQRRDWEEEAVVRVRDAGAGVAIDACVADADRVYIGGADVGVAAGACVGDFG